MGGGDSSSAPQLTGEFLHCLTGDSAMFGSAAGRAEHARPGTAMHRFDQDHPGLPLASSLSLAPAPLPWHGHNFAARPCALSG